MLQKPELTRQEVKKFGNAHIVEKNFTLINMGPLDVQDVQGHFNVEAQKRYWLRVLMKV